MHGTQYTCVPFFVLVYITDACNMATLSCIGTGMTDRVP